MAEAARGHACGAPSSGPQNSSDCGRNVRQFTGSVHEPVSNECVRVEACQLNNKVCPAAVHPHGSTTTTSARAVASLLHLNLNHKHRQDIVKQTSGSADSDQSVTLLTSFSSGLASLSLAGPKQSAGVLLRDLDATDMPQNESNNMKVAGTGSGLCCTGARVVGAINEDDGPTLGSEHEHEREQEQEDESDLGLGLEEEGLCSSHSHHSHDDMNCSSRTGDDNDKKRRRTDRYDSSESSDSGVASLGSSDASSWSSTSDITEPASPASSAASLTSQPSPLNLNGLLASPRYTRTPSPHHALPTSHTQTKEDDDDEEEDEIEHENATRGEREGKLPRNRRCAGCLGPARTLRRRHSATPTFYPLNRWKNGQGRHRHASDPSRHAPFTGKEEGSHAHQRRRCQLSPFHPAFEDQDQEHEEERASLPDSKTCLSSFALRLDKLWCGAHLADKNAQMQVFRDAEEEDPWLRTHKKRVGEDVEDHWMKRIKLEAALTHHRHTIWDLRAQNYVQPLVKELEEQQSYGWEGKSVVVGRKGQGRITDYFKAQAKSSLLREHCMKMGIKAETLNVDRQRQEKEGFCLDSTAQTTPTGLEPLVAPSPVTEFLKPTVPATDATPRLRFPPLAQAQHSAGPKIATECHVERIVCLWKTCGDVLGTSHQLLGHIERVHVQTQEGNHFSCEWEGCKVQGKKSCSSNWLQRHVLSHGGSNKPFGCIVDSCEQRFSTRAALERHVNSHFSQQTQGNVGSSGPHGKKSHDVTTIKLLRRNSKKFKARRKPAPARLFDYFDAGIMERLKYQLLRITARETALGFSLNGEVNLTSQVLGQRIGANGNLQVLVHWTPENLLPDEWILASDLIAEKHVPIAHLGARARVLLYEAMYGRGSSQPGQPAKKHQRKNKPTSATPNSLT